MRNYIEYIIKSAHQSTWIHNSNNFFTSAYIYLQFIYPYSLSLLTICKIRLFCTETLETIWNATERGNMIDSPIT